jgi:hypothetical protein
MLYGEHLAWDFVFCYRALFCPFGSSTRLVLYTMSALSLYLSMSSYLRGNFFQCHVFAMKSVQNLKSFWRSSQNYFVLALFSSLYS